MFSKFFIDRPRFSIVISIGIILMGLLALNSLPVQQYPTLTPPQITVNGVYPGATAKTISDTAAAPLEEAINGVEDMIYMTSTSSSTGYLKISVYFKIGTNPDVAIMNVNNRVQSAIQDLPAEVRKYGIDITERSPDLLKVFSFKSKGNKRNAVEISNYVLVNIVDDLKRVDGVGDATIFGEKRFAIRVWTLPDKLAQFKLTPIDVANAIQTQNQQFTAGILGDEPNKNKQIFTYSVKAEERFKSVEAFENIIIRANNDGSQLKLKDIARIELSSENFSMDSFSKKQPSIPVGIYLSTGANALSVSKALDEKIIELSKKFPQDIQYEVPYDPSIFVHKAIDEVIFTLALSILLVIFVIYIFLGSMRATLIPLLAIPVSIIGTFAGLYAAGFSINLLTLFGLILSIGLVVDDAIVVIENVERILREENLPIREATIKAMSEITGPVVAIVLVLSAVFVPASFIGGFSGKMYQQFAITIAISVIISGLVALTLTPALCVVFLKKEMHKPILPIKIFQDFFDYLSNLFSKGVKIFIKLSVINLLLFAIMIYLTFHITEKLKKGLVPYEDEGALYILTNLMPGSSLERTKEVVNKLEDNLFATNLVSCEVSFAGLDLTSFAYKSDAAISFVHLTDWSERKSKDLSSLSLASKFTKLFSAEKEALIFAVNPPPVRGMSMTGGFEMYIQDRGSGDVKMLDKLVKDIVAQANQSEELMSVRSTLNTNVPQYSLVVDREKARALGVEIDDIYKSISMTFSKSYVNDFNMFGRTYHVNIQSESEYRDKLNNYSNIFVKSKSNSYVPISSLISIERIVDADIIERFNMFISAKITGQAKPGYSSGDSMKRIEEIAKKVLPENYTIDWAGTSYQEKTFQKSGHTAFIFAIVFVLLILVALYESWMAPIAILMTVPFGIFGAALGMYLRGLENDIYFQVGIITLVGLTVKNAILIVEFAEERLKKRGMDLLSATIDAAKVRFRPIIMTSFAFIAGSLPLAISTGPGANSRHIIGTTVVSGMFFATIVGTFFIPLFYYLFIKLKQKSRKNTTIEGNKI